jgi:homocysteine S-methyltransferase
LWPLVAGSIGPYGAARADGSEYRGNYGVGREALRQFHRPRLEALVEASPDLLAVETCPSPVEAEVVLELLARWPEVRAWVSFTCRDDSHVSEGQPIGEAARAAVGSPQVVAVGINCVNPSYVEGLLTRLRDVTELPLVVYPNSGETWDAERRCWTGASAPFDPERETVRWLGLGARLIGGCCRTTPATITGIRRALAQQKHEPYQE